MEQLNSIDTSKNYTGLYSIFIRRLKEINTRSDLIAFPDVFEKLCRNFSIKKEECWKILRFLKENGVIEIIFSHGVKIKKFSEVEIREIIS